MFKKEMQLTTLNLTLMSDPPNNLKHIDYSCMALKYSFFYVTDVLAWQRLENDK